MNHAAPILLTVGDPVGIGPELIAHAHARGALQDVVVVGEPAVVQRGLDLLAQVSHGASPTSRSRSCLSPS